MKTIKNVSIVVNSDTFPEIARDLRKITGTTNLRTKRHR